MTFSNLHTSLAKSAKNIKRIVDQREEKLEAAGIAVSDFCSVIPVTYSSRLLLHKEYWDKPTIQYSEEIRQQMFGPVLDNPKLYNLLVLPQQYDEKKDTWQFFAAIPFLFNTPSATIDQFMKTSNAPVDTRAKYAALYHFGSPLSFNWKTGKRSKLLTPSPAKQFN